MARVARLTRYPVKALSGETVESARITSGGTLAGDREFALFAADGDPVNGKRTRRVHDIETTCDAGVVTVTTEDDDATFDLRDADGRADAETWFSDFFDLDVEVRRDAELGFVDRRRAGPSVISTATLETVADWYDVTVENVRRRMRANVEIAGVPAFWEDQFVGDGPDGFHAGDVSVSGVEPCGRCVVPERDPDTGDRDPEFRERFLTRREATFPDWVDRDAFDHYYALMLIADVPAADRGETLTVGDSVTIP